MRRVALFHGIHRPQHGCFPMLASRGPFGVYYLESEDETRLVAVLDLRRHPDWMRNQVIRRSSRAP